MLVHTFVLFFGSFLGSEKFVLAVSVLLLNRSGGSSVSSFAFLTFYGSSLAGLFYTRLFLSDGLVWVIRWYVLAPSFLDSRFVFGERFPFFLFRSSYPEN